MIQYFSAIPILLTTLICLMFLSVINKQILRSHKIGFLVLFPCIFFITICEAVTILLDGAAVKFMPFHFLANYFGFLLTPVVLAFFASSIGRFHRSKFASIGISAYFILYNVLVFSKQLFFIDEQNIYHRGNLFYIYIIAYIVATLYLFYESFRYSSKGFLYHEIFAYFLCFLFLALTSLQVFFPKIYLTRITVVLLSCIYYAYNVEFSSLFDQLTGLLNHGTFQKKSAKIKHQQIVVILDIDNFKFINDNYGHQYGDDCLSMVSRTIKLIFGSYGHCFRLGGDEFAIILRKNTDINALISRFEKAITDQFENSKFPLTVSVGYSKYEDGEPAEDAIKRADFNMYTAKNQRKKEHRTTDDKQISFL